MKKQSKERKKPVQSWPQAAAVELEKNPYLSLLVHTYLRGWSALVGVGWIPLAE